MGAWGAPHLGGPHLGDPLPRSQVHLGASQCQDDSEKGRNLVISQLESVVKINVFWGLKGCQTHTEPNRVLKMCSSR